MSSSRPCGEIFELRWLIVISQITLILPPIDVCNVMIFNVVRQLLTGNCLVSSHRSYIVIPRYTVISTLWRPRKQLRSKIFELCRLIFVPQITLILPLIDVCNVVIFNVVYQLLTENCLIGAH